MHTCRNEMRNSHTFRLQFTPLLVIFLTTAYFISSVANRLQVSSQTFGLPDLVNGVGWLLLVATILTAHRATPLFAALADRIPPRLQAVAMVILGVASTYLMVWPRAGFEVAITAVVLAALLLTLVRLNNRVAVLVFRALALAGVAVLLIRLIR